MALIRLLLDKGYMYKCILYSTEKLWNYRKNISNFFTFFVGPLIPNGRGGEGEGEGEGEEEGELAPL